MTSFICFASHRLCAFDIADQLLSTLRYNIHSHCSIYIKIKIHIRLTWSERIAILGGARLEDNLSFLSLLCDRADQLHYNGKRTAVPCIHICFQRKLLCGAMFVVMQCKIYAVSRDSLVILLNSSCDQSCCSLSGSWWVRGSSGHVKILDEVSLRSSF